MITESRLREIIRESLRDGSYKNNSLRQTGFYTNNQEYVAYGFKFAYEFKTKIGLTAATFSSADSALTALTTAFCIDFCPWNQWSEEEQKRRRQWVHICLSAILFIVILGFSFTEGEGVVWLVFKAAMLTYGPLLGLFAFALLTKRQTQEKWVPYLMVLSVVLIYLLNHFSAKLLGGYKFGFELLLVNGMLCFTCLWLFSTKVPAKLQSD